MMQHIFLSSGIGQDGYCQQHAMLKIYNNSYVLDVQRKYIDLVNSARLSMFYLTLARLPMTFNCNETRPVLQSVFDPLSGNT